MEVRKEEIQNNLRKLDHCIIGSWDPSSARGEDLETLGRSLVKIWGLKGNLGLARLEENKVLLEFELMGEATWDCRASIIAMEPEHFEKSGGGVWRIYSNGPSDGKVAGASMGSDIDQNRGEDLPRVLEIAVEEKVYSLALWWELKPALRKAQENRREAYERTRGEVRGDGGSRADTELAKRAQGRSGARPSMEVVDLGPSSLGQSWA
ncbi:hypothetical protein CK203_055874 [Vitis vinifera]|uniref:DUF4283 domain-containing protein n=1 Tax=Vitis vinifera TaxID=29760 RepID=A0A438GPA0_VITVI|nr:hypothetical protein CK203_055874 [Vitis vinifera]